jgi:hypothetical protein
MLYFYRVIKDTANNYFLVRGGLLAVFYCRNIILNFLISLQRYIFLSKYFVD